MGIWCVVDVIIEIKKHLGNHPSIPLVFLVFKEKLRMYVISPDFLGNDPRLTPIHYSVWTDPGRRNMANLPLNLA